MNVWINESKLARVQSIRAIASSMVVLAFAFTTYGQQTMLSAQYIYNGLLINPAYAGSHLQFSATLTYRNQWVNFPGAPKNVTFGAHTSLFKEKVGVGALFTNDQIGSYNNTAAYFSYAYKIKIPQRNGVFSMGLQVGVNNYRSDFNLTLRSPFDPSFGSINELKPNVGGGVFYYDDKFFAGFSVPHIITYSELYDNGLANFQTPRFYYVNGGMKLPLSRSSDKFILQPSFLLRVQDGSPVSADLNASVIYDNLIGLGASYRTGDSVTSFINLKISEKFFFGYHYEWLTSELRSYSSGSHEFILNFRTRIRGVHKDVECPFMFSH